MNNNGLNYEQLLTEVKKLKDTDIIRFDFCNFTPEGFHSYRGYYEDCAIGYSNEYDNLTAADFARQLEAMYMQDLHGYKGGTWQVKNTTSIWVSKDSSECSGTIITGITDLGYGYAVINTAYED